MRGRSEVVVLEAAQAEQGRRVTQMQALGQSGVIGVPQRSSRRAVTIGLLNNMGDEALIRTERQFGGLLALASEDVEVILRIFALEDI